MEYYTPEAIEKYKEKEPVMKKANKKKRIIIKTILILIGIFIFMQTPLYDLTVVSLRWGRPMIYKDHIQMGAIWDPRPREYTAFSAFPLGGDPEEDDFCIRRKNKLFVLPNDIKDGYFYICKRDEIEAEAERIANKAGFKDVKVYLRGGHTHLSPKGLWKNASIDEIKNNRNVDLDIVIYSKYINTMTDDEIIEKFEKMQNEYSEWGANVEFLKMTLYYDDSNFENATRMTGNLGKCICLTSYDGKKATFIKD